MNFYAQIDENNKCIGISELAEPDFRNNLIKIPIFDENLIGLYYDRENKNWNMIGDNYDENLLNDEEIIIQPTQLDRIESQLIELQQIVTALLSNN